MRFALRLHRYALVALLGGAALVPSPLLARQSAEQDVSVSAAAADAARPEAPAPVGTRVTDDPWAPGVADAHAAAWAMLGSPVPSHALPSADLFVLPQQSANAGPNVALMGVGVAALVVGLIIGGDAGMVIAATGGVIGLVGLYRYLR